MAPYPKRSAALNGICPYFTMFPLEFPLAILEGRARPGDHVLDPFCGRGTTNFAAKLLNLYSLGVDSSKVATAITAAKLASPAPSAIVRAARAILDGPRVKRVPQGRFWRAAFHPEVLWDLCTIRRALLKHCHTPARMALRGIMLGALHGPRQNVVQSYFSNQSPRTYAPKPDYAVRFWKARRLIAEKVDTLGIIRAKAERFYAERSTIGGLARLGDSRREEAFVRGGRAKRFKWVITSPPYYGMRTYVQDQWLRHWFLGGESMPRYSAGVQVDHGSPEAFASDLQRVWLNAAKASSDDARLVVRFGGISDRQVPPLDILKLSLLGTGWRIQSVVPAGTAKVGKRQADTFLRGRSKPVEEHDVWASRD